jgi:hypothetical protein
MVVLGTGAAATSGALLQALNPKAKALAHRKASTPLSGLDRGCAVAVVWFEWFIKRYS